jgi:hypothetical protein
VDFGLAKRHLNDDLKNPVPARKKADFRGTVSFASLNAHNNVVSNKARLTDEIGPVEKRRSLESIFCDFGFP